MEGPLIASKVKRRNSRLLGLRESVFLKLEMLPHPPNSNSCVTVVSTVELDNFYHGIYIYIYISSIIRLMAYIDVISGQKMY